jgi:hypothetical protein
VCDWRRNLRARAVEFGLWFLVGAAAWATSFVNRIPPHPSQPVLVLGPIPWTLYDSLSQMLHDSWSYLHLRSLGELFWAATIAYWGGIWTVRSLRVGRLVRAWFIFWLATSYLFYGYAGEKVPWLALHVMLPLWLLAALLWNEWTEACAVPRRRAFVAALCGALLVWNAWQACRLCFVNPTASSELAIYNHTQESAKQAADKLVERLEKREVNDNQVVVQGEASWPLTWYLRRFPRVRFEPSDYCPTLTDAVVVTDPGTEDRVPMLRLDFKAAPFELRSCWVAPTIDVGESLCLRPVGGEPAEAGKRLDFRLRRSGAILKTLARYVLFRRAYGYLPLPPNDQPFGPVYSIVWDRQRLSPEPILPPDRQEEK